MNLEQQMQALIDNAPQDGQTPMIMEAIAPVLKHFADRLQHSQYYILQSPHQSWLVTTLSNRNQPELEKNVIYAFTTPQDSFSFQPNSQPQNQSQNPVLAIPVLQILFQIFALTMVDSVIFFEVPGNTVNGTEVRRQDLATAIQSQLQQIRTIHKNSALNLQKKSPKPPSNIV
jgi:hypothetical protein